LFAASDQKLKSESKKNGNINIQNDGEVQIIIRGNEPRMIEKKHKFDSEEDNNHARIYCGFARYLLLLFLSGHRGF